MHLVGAGSANSLLNRFTADAANITVVVGPREATAVGNILAQAVAAGLYPDLTAARRDLARTFASHVVAPATGATSRAAWDGACNRFLGLIEKHGLAPS